MGNIASSNALEKITCPSMVSLNVKDRVFVFTEQQRTFVIDKSVDIDKISSALPLVKIPTLEVRLWVKGAIVYGYEIFNRKTGIIQAFPGILCTPTSFGWSL